MVLKTFLFISVFLLSWAHALEFPFLDGEYLGQGREGASNVLTAREYSIKNKVLAGLRMSRMNYADGSSFIFRYHYQLNPDSTLNVRFMGNHFGQGFCLGNRCHYTIPSAGIEETLSVSADSVVILGSRRDASGLQSFWEEKLVRARLPERLVANQMVSLDLVKLSGLDGKYVVLSAPSWFKLGERNLGYGMPLETDVGDSKIQFVILNGSESVLWDLPITIRSGNPILGD